MRRRACILTTATGRQRFGVASSRFVIVECAIVTQTVRYTTIENIQTASVSILTIHT